MVGAGPSGCTHPRFPFPYPPVVASAASASYLRRTSDPEASVRPVLTEASADITAGMSWGTRR